MAQVKTDPRVTYFVMQKERGAQGTEHFQGYIHMANPVTMRAIKDIINDRIHCEIARGNGQQNKDYCTKEEGRIDGPWEFGELPTQGKRKDLELMRDAVVNDGKTREQLIMSDLCSTALRYDKAYATLRRIRAKKIGQQKPEVWVLWGATGAGKSRRARTLAPGAYEKADGKWWDGYDGEESVIWDDFDPEQYPLRALLKITDYYGKKVEVKGSYDELIVTKIVFTSNIRPEHWYMNESQEHRDALLRRIDHIIEFKADGTEVIHK
jgi:hypothetical protein